MCGACLQMANRPRLCLESMPTLKHKRRQAFSNTRSLIDCVILPSSWKWTLMKTSAWVNLSKWYFPLLSSSLLSLDTLGIPEPSAPLGLSRLSEYYFQIGSGAPVVMAKNFRGLKKNSMTSRMSTFPTVFTALNTALVLVLFSLMLFNTFGHYRIARTMLSTFQMSQYSFNLHRTILWFTPFYRCWNSGNESKPHTPSLCS